MTRPRLRLIDVMALVAFAALLFGLIRFLGHTPFLSNHRHDAAVAIYLAVLSTSILGTLVGHRQSRPFFAGIALYGSIYLAFGLKFAWSVAGYEEADALETQCLIALPLGLLCGLAAHWLIPGGSPKPEPLTEAPPP